jgi:DNA-binding MarR family transcriptional regulator
MPRTTTQKTETRDIEEMLRPSGLILETENVLGRAIDLLTVARTSHSPTTLDLLVRLSLSPNRQLRGVDLCRQLLKSPGYVSRLIDQAESDGLVVRRVDPDDRRAQRITLTKAGEDALDEVLPHVLEVLDQTVYAALDESEIETLVDLLSRIAVSAHQLLEQGDGVSP